MRLQDVAYFSDVSMTEKVVPGLIVPGMVSNPHDVDKTIEK